MDLSERVKRDFEISGDFAESKNYYFENHICPKTGDNIKIKLDYKLSHEMSDEILKFGKCEKCGLIIYHKDYE